MRLILAAALGLLAWPALAAGQATDRTPTLPPIGLPLPSIGLPLAPIGLPPADAGDPAPPAPAPPRGRRGFVGPAVIYVVSPYGWGPSYRGTTARTPTYVPEPTPAPAAPSTGTLRLAVARDVDVQVAVDGFYVGTADDLGDELTLAPGAHHVALHAPGYEPIAFDVRIEAGRAITYRGTLEASAPSTASAPGAAPPRSTLFLIPGCYMGNVHPRELDLPPGCDVTRVVVREP